MSAYTPANDAEIRVLTAIRNDDYKAWAAHLEAAGIQPASASREFSKAVYEAVLLRALGNLAFDVHERDELERLRQTFLLSEEEAAAIKSRRARKAVKALAKHLYTDGIFTPSEQAELEALGAELTLSKVEVTHIIADVIEDKR